MSISITDNGDTPVKINRGKAYSVAVSGGFDSGTLSVQYATAEAAAASLTTSLTGADNDLVYTAKNAGTDGNSLTVAYIDPVANNAELSVAFTYPDIVVNLATGGAGAITSTAAEVQTAIEATDATRHLTIANAAANDGTGVVTALAETALASGTDGTFVTYSSGDGGAFTAAGERAFDQCGEIDTINLNVASVAASSATLTVVVKELDQ